MRRYLLTAMTTFLRFSGAASSQAPKPLTKNTESQSIDATCADISGTPNTFVETFLKDPLAIDQQAISAFVDCGLHFLEATQELATTDHTEGAPEIIAEHQSTILILSRLFIEPVAQAALSNHPIAAQIIAAMARDPNPSIRQASLNILLHATGHANIRRLVLDTVPTLLPEQADSNILNFLYLLYLTIQDKPWLIIVYLAAGYALKSCALAVAHQDQLTRQFLTQIHAQQEQGIDNFKTELYHTQITELNKEIATLKDNLTRLAKDYSTKIAKMEKAILEKDALLKTLRQQQAPEDLAKIQELEAETARLETVLAAEKATSKEYATTLGTLRRELETQTRDLEKSQKTCATLSEQSVKQLARIKALEKNVQEKITEIIQQTATLRQTIVEHKKQMAAKQADIKSHTTNLEAAASENAKLQQTIAQQKDQLAQIDANIKSLKEQLNKSTAETNTQLQTISQLKIEAIQTQDKIQTLEDQLKQSNAAYAKLEQDLHQSKLENQRLTEKTDLLDEKHRAQSQTIDELKATIKALQTHATQMQQQLYYHLSIMSYQNALPINYYLTQQELAYLPTLQARQATILAILSAVIPKTSTTIAGHISCNFLPHSDDDYCFKIEPSQTLYDNLIQQLNAMQENKQLTFEAKAFSPQQPFIHVIIQFNGSSRPCDFVFSMQPDHSITSHTALYQFTMHQNENAIKSTPIATHRRARRLGDLPLQLNQKRMTETSVLHMIKCMLNEAHLQHYPSTNPEHFLSLFDAVSTQFIQAGLRYQPTIDPQQQAPSRENMLRMWQIQWQSAFWRIIQARSQIASSPFLSLYQSLQSSDEIREAVNNCIQKMVKRCFNASIAQLSSSGAAASAANHRSRLSASTALPITSSGNEASTAMTTRHRPGSSNEP